MQPVESKPQLRAAQGVQEVLLMLRNQEENLTKFESVILGVKLSGFVLRLIVSHYRPEAANG